MTTKSDWEFRATYLREAADGLDRRAEAMRAEANRYRVLASRAEVQAGAMSRDEVVDVPRQYGASRLPSATQVAEAA